MNSRSLFISGLAVLWLVIAATWAAPTWSAEPEWVFVDENPDSRFYYDKNYDKNGNGSPKKDVIRVKTRVAYTKEGRADALMILADPKLAKISETHYTHELNCKEKESRLLQAEHFDQEGALLKKTDLASATEWEDIPPEARMALVAERACSDRADSEKEKKK